MVVQHHPPPHIAQRYRIPKIWPGDLESDLGKSLLACNEKGPAVMMVTTINVDPQKSPCVYECLLEHENVHKRMCEQLGAKFTSLSQAQKEIPAYIQELGCYLKTLYENHLGPYAQ